MAALLPRGLVVKTTVTFLALLALAIASFALSYVHTGALFAGANLVVALAIAAAKAVLVIAIFMELWHAKATSVLALGTALAFVSLLVGMTLAEKLTRTPPPLAPASITTHVPAH